VNERPLGGEACGEPLLVGTIGLGGSWVVLGVGVAGSLALGRAGLQPATAQSRAPRTMALLPIRNEAPNRPELTGR